MTDGLGFRRLVFCSCIYIKVVDNNKLILVYDYVDDFIFTGNDSELVRATILDFRQLCETTEPIWDAERVLGMEFTRDRTKNLINITMTDKITDMCTNLK